METVRLFGVLVFLVRNWCLCSIDCEKVNLEDLEGEPNDVCYSEESKGIKCPRNQTILIPTLLQRVHPSEEEDPSSCRVSVRDKYYDIGRCLLDTSDVHEKTVYEAAMREVLVECSQKRYCILESDKASSIHGLKHLPVGEGSRHSSHLVVLRQCVKDQVASLVLCDSETQTDKEVYISSDQLRMSALGTSTCLCTVSGAASHVTLLDVRLGNSNRTRLSIRDKTRSVYTVHGGQQTLHFMKEIRMSQTEWSLHLDVVKDQLPDKIWMRVQGNNSTKVTVTCEESTVADVDPGSGETGWRLIFLVVGFCAGVVIIGIISMLCMKRKRRSPLSVAPSPRFTPEGNDAFEPVYSIPHQYRETVPPRQLSVKSQGAMGSCNKDSDNSMSLANLTIDQNKLRANTDPGTEN